MQRRRDEGNAVERLLDLAVPDRPEVAGRDPHALGLAQGGDLVEQGGLPGPGHLEDRERGGRSGEGEDRAGGRALQREQRDLPAELAGGRPRRGPATASRRPAPCAGRPGPASGRRGSARMSRAVRPVGRAPPGEDLHQRAWPPAPGTAGAGPPPPGARRSAREPGRPRRSPRATDRAHAHSAAEGIGFRGLARPDDTDAMGAYTLPVDRPERARSRSLASAGRARRRAQSVLRAVVRAAGRPPPASGGSVAPRGGGRRPVDAPAFPWCRGRTGTGSPRAGSPRGAIPTATSAPRWWTATAATRAVAELVDGAPRERAGGAWSPSSCCRSDGPVGRALEPTLGRAAATAARPSSPSSGPLSTGGPSRPTWTPRCARRGARSCAGSGAASGRQLEGERRGA